MMKLLYLTLIISTVAVAAPYQELPPKAGHVPVYIREGDTPLSEVNPKLVEAFHEDESAKSQLEDKTPEVVPEASEANNTTSEEKTKEVDIKDEIINAAEAKIESVTASDIAEFDNVKPENDDLVPEKAENKVEANE